MVANTSCDVVRRGAVLLCNFTTRHPRCQRKHGLSFEGESSFVSAWRENLVVEAGLGSFRHGELHLPLRILQGDASMGRRMRQGEFPDVSRFRVNDESPEAV